MEPKKIVMEKFGNHEYLVRPFMPQRVFDMILRAEGKVSKATRDELDAESYIKVRDITLKEMVLDPRIDDEFLNSDDCNYLEMMELVAKINEEDKLDVASMEDLKDEPAKQ